MLDLVHQAFKDAGYLTDTRPLKVWYIYIVTARISSFLMTKLHCTILNTSHRKNRFRQPFSYSDILASDALRFLCGHAGDSNSQSVATEANSFAHPEAELAETATIQEGKPTGSIPDNLSISLPQPNTSSSNPDPHFKVSLNISTKSKGHSVMNNPTYVSVNLGVFPVEEIQLWVLGSHGPNNEYVSCGGMLLEWKYFFFFFCKYFFMDASLHVKCCLRSVSPWNWSTWLVGWLIGWRYLTPLASGQHHVIKDWPKAMTWKHCESEGWE